MDINRLLLGGLALSLFAHASAAALLGHFGTSFDETEAVIDVEILLEGNSEEVVVQSLPPRPKPAKVKTPKLEEATLPETATVKEQPELSDPSPATHPENFSTSSTAQAQQGRALDASEKYVMELRKVLSQNVVYPSMARRLKQKGRVVVRFKLRNDGQLIKAEVIESSKFALLNDAAAELIRKIDKMKPFPEELKDHAVQDFTIPIEYAF